jgi:hypothetical protein
MYQSEFHNLSQDLSDLQTPNMFVPIQGSGNEIVLSLADKMCLDTLKIPSTLKSELEQYVRTFEELSFLTPKYGFDVENIDHEGRGIYLKVDDNTFYLKGCGSPELANISACVRRFPAFITGKSPLADSPEVDFPRVFGAMSLAGCRSQFAAGLAQFEQYIIDENINTLDELLREEVPIPIAVCRYGELSKELHQATLLETQKLASPPKLCEVFGSVLYKVPNSKRFSTDIFSASEALEQVQALGRAIGKGLKSGWCFANGSCHIQNFYKPSKNGNVWFADQVDMLPTVLLSKYFADNEEVKNAISNTRLSSNRSLSYSNVISGMIDHEILSGIHTISYILISKDHNLNNLSAGMKYAYRTKIIRYLLSGMLEKDVEDKQLKLLSSFLACDDLDNSNSEGAGNTYCYGFEAARILREELIPASLWDPEKIDIDAQKRIESIFGICGAHSLDSYIEKNLSEIGITFGSWFMFTAEGNERIRERVNNMWYQNKSSADGLEAIAEELHIDLNQRITESKPSDWRKRLSQANLFVKNTRAKQVELSSLAQISESGPGSAEFLDILDKGIGRKLFEKDLGRISSKSPGHLVDLLNMKMEVLQGKLFKLDQESVASFFNTEFDVPNEFPIAVDSNLSERAALKRMVKRWKGGFVEKMVNYTYSELIKIFETALPDKIHKRLCIEGDGSYSSVFKALVMEANNSYAEGPEKIASFVEMSDWITSFVAKSLKKKRAKDPKLDQTFFKLPDIENSIETKKFLQELIYCLVWYNVHNIPFCLDVIQNTPSGDISKKDITKDNPFCLMKYSSVFISARTWKLALQANPESLGSTKANLLRRKIKTQLLEMLRPMLRHKLDNESFNH